MCIDNVEVVRVNRLAVDRSLAIDGLVHRIVARCRRAEGILERLVHLRIANVMRRAVARICVGAEGTARTVPVAARCRAARALTLPRAPQRTSCDAVTTEDRSDDRGLRGIRDLRDTAVRIGRRAVIGLGHVAHLDVQLARRNLARVCHRAGIRRECLICASARDRTDDRISCVDNLIVVRILPCELGRIGDILVDDIAAAVTRDILIRIACRRGIRRQSVRLIRNHRRKADDIAPAFDIAAAVRMLRHTVIDLLDGVRRRADRARGNRPLCGHMRGVCIIHSLEVTERSRRLLCRGAKGIVRQRMIRRIARACHNVIGDVVRLRDVGGAVVPVGIAGEMPRRAGLQRKGHLAVVPRDNPCIARCPRSRQICAGRERMAVVPVIDLRRVCNRVVCIVYAEAGLIDAAARDLAHTVLLVRDLIVIVRERIRKPRILYCAVSCIDVLGKCPCSARTIAAGDPRHIEIRRCDIVRADNSAGEAVIQRRECFIRIGGRAVVDLCHIVKGHCQRTRRDRPLIAGICERLRRYDRLYALCAEGIVLRLRPRSGIEGCRIGNALRRRIAAAIHHDVLRRVLRRRGIRTRLRAGKARKSDKRVALDDIAAAVGLVVHRVVDLRDVVVHDGRRQRLRRDLAVARCVECIAQRFLGRIVRVEHIVVGEIVLARIICLPRHLIGELRRFLDVLGTGSAVIDEMPFSARQRKRNMPLIARDNARVADSARIRREIDVRAGRIFAVPVIDFLRIDLRMRRLVIDVEAVTRNLARDDLAVEIDRLIRARNEGLCAARRGIVKLIVARVIAREPDIRILELVAAGVEFLVARRIRVLRTAYVCEVDRIHRIAVIAHNCAIGNGLIRIRGKWCELRLVQRDVRLGLKHVRIDDGRGAVIDLIGCCLLEDVEIERCLGDGRPAMQITEGGIVKGVVPRILAGKSNRTGELNSFIGTDILVRNQAGGFIDHLCLKVSGGKV